jgi:hypothetical protein
MLLNKISTVKHRNLKEWCHAKRDAIFNFKQNHLFEYGYFRKQNR